MKPSLRSRFCRSSVISPGSTVTVRLGRSISSMRFIREKWITSPPRVGMVPPLKFVPEPRAMTGIFSRKARTITADTSAVVPGRTTMSGFPLAREAS